MKQSLLSTSNCLTHCRKSDESLLLLIRVVLSVNPPQCPSFPHLLPRPRPHPCSRMSELASSEALYLATTPEVRLGWDSDHSSSTLDPLSQQEMRSAEKRDGRKINRIRVEGISGKEGHTINGSLLRKRYLIRFAGWSDNNNDLYKILNEDTVTQGHKQLLLA